LTVGLVLDPCSRSTTRGKAIRSARPGSGRAEALTSRGHLPRCRAYPPIPPPTPRSRPSTMRRTSGTWRRRWRGAPACSTRGTRPSARAARRSPASRRDRCFPCPRGGGARGGTRVRRGASARTPRRARLAMGFCLFNNVAIAAARSATPVPGARRGLGCHHGNGTQHLFEEDPTVFYFSVHQFPLYRGTGRRRAGEGARLGPPQPALPRAPGDDASWGRCATWRRRALLPPEMVLVSCGFDAHARTPGRAHGEHRGLRRGHAHPGCLGRGRGAGGWFRSSRAATICRPCPPARPRTSAFCWETAVSSAHPSARRASAISPTRRCLHVLRIASGRVDTGSFRIEQVLEDIESLNRRPAQELEVSASASTPTRIWRGLRPHALWGQHGDGYGRLVVAREPLTARRSPPPPSPYRAPSPRPSWPCASISARLRAPRRPLRPHPRRGGEGGADAGSSSTRGQLTYARQGRSSIVDLGSWWGSARAASAPAGGNAVRRDLGLPAMRELTRILRDSID
jgi:hypothetical protein